MQTNIANQTYLLALSREELRSFAESIGEPTYRADQLFKGIYAQRMTDFSSLTTISKNLRAELDQQTILRSFNLQKKTRSTSDNTTKFLWKLSDGMSIESVIIYEADRTTFCISSQVGCALDCKFCATGKMGFLRNLNSGEIIEQVLQMSAVIERLPTNIVFMGMGEPLLNLRQVVKAADVLSDTGGLSIPRKKITISTSGVLPGIRKLADSDSPYSLAISLNAVFEEERREIMPISYQYPLQDLMQTIEYYVKQTGKRVTFEYILIAGKNDRKQDADQIIKLTARIPCKINLIPCNSDDPEFPPPDKETVRWFNEYLAANRRTATVRMRKGWEIQAACGQLYAAVDGRQGKRVTF